MKFGAEIAVNGVRPKWLADDEPVRVAWAEDYGANWSVEGAWTAGQISANVGQFTFSRISHIRLPKNHWAYGPLGIGYEPWAGGRTEPSDWVGGGVETVLFRDGVTIGRCVGTWTWCSQITSDADIIGYKKRVDPVAAAEPTTDPTVALLTEIRDLLKPKVLTVDRDIIAWGDSIGRGGFSFAPYTDQPEPEPLTIRITGPQGSGKTRWAELIQNLPAALLGFPVPVVVDGEVG